MHLALIEVKKMRLGSPDTTGR